MAYNTGIPCRVAGILLVGVLGTVPLAADAKPLSPELQAALQRAGNNKQELLTALEKVPGPQREGMEFLIANMPVRDLTGLKADFLLRNTQYAFAVMEEVPWGKRVPKAIFLNYVLPYANVNERRDDWRKDFHARFLPLVKDCKTPAEAGAVLNEKIFPQLKVRYSKQRPKPDQSPYESIEAEFASCTGLSILLVDACRAVGVPARFVGIRLWPDRSGNHSWVEIWDGGWHFTGAAEPTGKQLDRAWFAGRAATAKADHPLHAIYAASFRRTPLRFPLPWDPRIDYVSAVNVTDRYAHRASLNEQQQRFVESPEGRQLAERLKQYFDLQPAKRKDVRFEPAWNRHLLERSLTVRKMAWAAYRNGHMRRQLQGDAKACRVTHEKFVSPYVVRAVGKMPDGGWPLFIAMHGGGGAPKKVNDQQWRVMQHYYHDQQGVGGYLYLAPRAPTDAWNGFYTSYNLPLTDKLIRQMLLFADVNPNKVYLMGYSHGGYGAFYQGMRMADRFAAVHASAAAPTAYDEMSKNLRNTVFTFMIGKQDTRHGRYRRCVWLDEYVKKLRGQRRDVYPVTMELKPAGHVGLPDRDRIKHLYPATRNPVPKHVVWVIDENVRCFNWLHAPGSGGGSVEAVCDDNEIKITAGKIGGLHLYLDERLIDYGKEVVIDTNGKRLVKTLAPSLRTLCETLHQRGDPEYMFATRVPLVLQTEAEKGK